VGATEILGQTDPVRAFDWYRHRWPLMTLNGI